MKFYIGYVQESCNLSSEITCFFSRAEHHQKDLPYFYHALLSTKTFSRLQANPTTQAVSDATTATTA